MVKITNEAANRLGQILQILDRANNSEESARKAELPKFNFTGKVLYAFGRNLKILAPILEELEKTRQRIIAKYSRDKSNDMQAVAMEDRPSVEAEFSEVLKMTNEVSFYQVDISQVNLDVNPIPPTFLKELIDTIFTGELA